MFKKLWNMCIGYKPDNYPFHHALRKTIPFADTPIAVLVLIRHVSERFSTTPTETGILFLLADDSEPVTIAHVFGMFPKISSDHLSRLLREMADDKLIIKHTDTLGMATYSLSTEVKDFLINLI